MLLTPVMPTVGLLGPVAVARRLPPRTEPNYLVRLAELVKDDIAARRSVGQTVDMDEYRAEFPELFVGRRTAGTDTPTPDAQPTAAVDVTPMPSAGGLSGERAGFPAVGTEFHGFLLEEELGRGAFARVYLGREHRLGDRPVALKVTATASGEPRRLARLQHTNIVPIHTAFPAGRLHVVQMPFFGRRTLGDLLDRIRAVRGFPHVDGGVFSTVAQLTTTRSHPLPADLDPLPDRSADKDTLPGPFAGKSYPDAVLWLMTRLADGLAHAHARDILHLDLKPANVLMADDGQPMLLDFNLSLDRATGDRDRVGGTWPYMSAEQIEEYAGTHTAPIDARADLFALGAIFFELLTLRHPFPAVRPGPDGLAEAVRERRLGVPSARAKNPAVTPAVDAIVRKLLAANPADRYPSAEALREDLTRQQEHRPLRYAADVSPAERFDKLLRRNPRLPLTVGLAATVGALAVGGWFLAATAADRDARAASARASAIRSELSGLRLDLTSPNDPTVRATASAAVGRWLAEYRGVSAKLPETDRAAVRDAIGEAALLAAESEWRTAKHGPPDARPSAARAAADWAKQAALVYGGDAPAAVRRLTAETTGETAPPAGETAADLFADASRAVGEGRYRDAIAPLERVVELDPGHYAGQFALGVSLSRLGRYERAAERLKMAQTLAPTDPRPRTALGLILTQIGKPAAAAEEFTAALRIRPGDAAGLFHRGLARLRAGKDVPGAMADLTAALDAGYARLPVLAARAEARDAAGDTAGAAADRAELATIEPATAVEWLARGRSVVRTDRAKALADYQRATALQPDYLIGWQNVASVLAVMPGREADALEASATAARLGPQFPPARVGHAVMLARAGKRDEAHAEAQAALLLADDPGTVYRAGCAYALTARTHPGDATTAFDLIRRAVASGFRELTDLAADDDLAALRGDPRFPPLAAAFRTLR